MIESQTVGHIDSIYLNISFSKEISAKHDRISLIHLVYGILSIFANLFIENFKILSLVKILGARRFYFISINNI